MATDAEALAAGFLLPTGPDRIRDGDDAIKHNAKAAVDLFDTFTGYVDDVSGLTGEDSAVALLVDTPSSDTTEALRKSFARVFTPEAYGAVGDYDPSANTGTDDTAAIQAALDAAKAVGGVVRFSEKHYRITAGLTVDAAFGITITGPRAGLGAGLTELTGAWLHYTGGAGAVMLTLNGSNVVCEGVGFHGRNNADGILITSDNTPITTNHTYRGLHFYRVVTGFYINDGGGVTQSDQMLIDSVRMAEVVETCFRTNSSNVTAIRWVRCSTALANSADDTVHYLFDRGALLQLDSCIGGYGQDFVRVVSEQVTAVSLDGCQAEGSTNPTYAFLRLGDTGDAGIADATTMRNCVVDGPVIVAGPSRRLLSQGNLWHVAGELHLTGADTVATLIGEAPPATVTTPGANAIVRNPDSKFTVGGATPSLASGTGATGYAVVGNTYAGKITFTTPAGLAADAEVVVVVPATAIGTGYYVNLTPANAAAAATQPFVNGLLSSQWSVRLHNPPAGATVLEFYYRVS